jgi:hypothetical protein
MFAGIRAKTADLDKLKVAKGMEKAGDTSRMEILRKTGWFRDNDNEWKFEISDKDAGFLIASEGIKKAGPVDASFSEMTSAERLAESILAEDLLYHPEFFAAYPEFKRIPIRVRRSAPGDKRIGGTTSVPLVTTAPSKQGKEWPWVDIDWPEFDPKQISIEVKGPYKSLLDSVLHEFQHVIQFRENFAAGGGRENSVMDYMKALNSHISKLHAAGKSSQVRKKGLKAELNRVRDLRNTGAVTDADSWEFYLRLSGEAEARNVMHRRKMTVQQRVDKPAWETRKIPEVIRQEGRVVAGPLKNIPEEDLIVLKEHTGEAWTGRGNAAGGLIDKPLYDDQRMIG